MDPPRPRANRATNETAPKAMIAASILLAVVQSGFSMGANSGWWSCAAGRVTFTTGSRFATSWRRWCTA